MFMISLAGSELQVVRDRRRIRPYRGEAIIYCVREGYGPNSWPACMILRLRASGGLGAMPPAVGSTAKPPEAASDLKTKVSILYSSGVDRVF